ncbi:MAG: PilZ domain-containing protein [Treponemataceae bacterium]|nr:PilZ domain-containing protein [Treponemataceae bacterium]
MYTVIIVLAAIAVVVAISRILVHKKKEISFFTTGIDSGFKFKEILLLYKVASMAQLEEPAALYWSIPALNRGIAYVLRTARQKGTENTPYIQDFLSKLYRYRTKVELDPRNSKSLKTTKGLNPGQRIRVVLKGFGVFSSSIVSVGRELVITLPVTNKGEFRISSKEWVGKVVSIYLNRPGDAGYVFDSLVHNSLTFNGKTNLYLAHTENLLRTQKRKTVRCACNIFAQLYVFHKESMSQEAVENEPGLKCLVEDISENGAMIRIGGIGRKNMQLKLQFPIGDRILVMFGITRAVEYNSAMNQSRLHLEGINVSPETKNAILSYVYNVMPKDDRDREEAIIQAEADSNEDINAVASVADNVGGEAAVEEAGKEGLPENIDQDTVSSTESYVDESEYNEYIPPEIHKTQTEISGEDFNFSFPEEEEVSKSKAL